MRDIIILPHRYQRHRGRAFRWLMRKALGNGNRQRGEVASDTGEIRWHWTAKVIHRHGPGLRDNLLTSGVQAPNREAAGIE